MATTLRTDAHLYPLYLKWASDSFRANQTAEGSHFFNLACDQPREAEHNIYKQMWELKGCPRGDSEYGRKAFHNSGGLSSSALEKAHAIDRFLRGVDRDELNRREIQVHKWLALLHGRSPEDSQYGRHAFYNTHGRFSSLEDKMSAAQMYEKASRVLTWHTNSHKVHLIRRTDGELENLIIDGSSERGWIMPFDRGRHLTEQAIQSLVKCDATVNGNALNISMLHRVSNFERAFNIGSKEIKLLTKGNSLIWRLFDNATRVASWIHVNNDDIQTIRSLNQMSNEEREFRSRGLIVEIETDNSHRLISACFICRSQMDTSKIIDGDNWAVTLISEGSSSNVDSGFGHAMIVCEGKRDGVQFTELIHLTAIDAPADHARVKIIPLALNSVRYTSKTPTWVRPRAFIERIREQDGRCFLFNQTGNELFSDTLTKNLARETIYVIGSTLFETFQDVLSQSPQRQCVNGLITKLVNIVTNELIPSDIYPLYNRIGTAFVTALVNNSLNELRDPSHWVEEYNCLTWAIKELRQAGISELPCLNSILAIPNRYIRSIPV